MDATNGMVSRKGELGRPGAKTLISAPTVNGKRTTKAGAARRALTKKRPPCSRLDPGIGSFGYHLTPSFLHSTPRDSRRSLRPRSPHRSPHPSTHRFPRRSLGVRPHHASCPPASRPRSSPARNTGSNRSRRAPSFRISRSSCCQKGSRRTAAASRKDNSSFNLNLGRASGTWDCVWRTLLKSRRDLFRCRRSTSGSRSERRRHRVRPWPHRKERPPRTSDTV